MSKKLFTVILPSLLITGFLAINAQAHDGSDSGSHYVVDGSGNPVKSTSSCVTSSGSGGGSSEACGDGAMAKAEMASAAAPAIDHQIKQVVVPEAAPAPVMMAPAKVMGAGHSHPANHCTNSITHAHARAGSAAHSHHYSCKRNAPKHMASPRQMAAPRQKAYY